MILSRVPIAVLTSDHLVVGGNAGELSAAQVEVGRQIDAVVGVVDAGFGAGMESSDIRKDWIEAPTRDVPRGVGRYRGSARAAVVGRIRLQQVQPGLIGFVLSP